MRIVLISPKGPLYPRGAIAESNLTPAGRRMWRAGVGLAWNR